MGSAAEAIGAIPPERLDEFFAGKLLQKDPAGTGLPVLDQDKLVMHIRVSRTYLELLGSPDFEGTPNRELNIAYETAFIESATRIAKRFGIGDSLLKEIKPDDETREKVRQDITKDSKLIPFDL